MINDLVKLASHLDRGGLFREANYLDKIIKVYAKRLSKVGQDNVDAIMEEARSIAEQTTAREAVRLMVTMSKESVEGEAPQKKHVSLAVALAIHHLKTTTNFCPIVDGEDQDLKELALLFIHMMPGDRVAGSVKECTKDMEPLFSGRPLTPESFTESGEVDETGWAEGLLESISNFFSSWGMNRQLRRGEKECEKNGGIWNGETGTCE